VNEDHATARHVPARRAFHDREGFSTTCSTKPFAIMENRFEMARLP